MPLTPWVTFVEACRSGSLSDTAELLGYTQSAVSRQVASLERDLGAKLLDRHPRGVRPTPAGAALLPHAQLLVATAERGRTAAATARAKAHVMLGAVPSASAGLLPVALARWPEPVEWTMVTGLTPDLLRQVSAGELDLAVVTDTPPGLPREATVELRHLVDDPMAVVLPARHPLADRRRLGVTSLADELWIEDNPGSEALLRQLAARHDLTLRIERSTGDLMTKTALVAAGHGVALVPRLLAPAVRPDVRLVTLSEAPRRGVYAATRRGGTDLRRLVAALRAAAQRAG